MDATKNKNTTLSNSQEEDEFLFDYFNSLSPLKTKECVEATQMLNSLGMNYSLFASLDALIHEDSIVLMRNKTLSTSKPTHKEAHACHYSLDPSSQHTKIELPQAMHDNPCSSEQCPLISAEEANWALELLGMQVSNGTNIQEVGQVEANIEGADCEHNNLSSITQSVNLLPQSTTNSNYKMQNVEHVASEPIAAADINQIWNNVALMDSDPISRGIDEVARINRSIMNSSPSHQPEMTSLQRNNSFYTSNISSCTTKSDKMNAINEKSLLPRKNTSCSSERKPESPSHTSSFHLSARQGHHLLSIPTPMERHLEPYENDEDLCWSTPDLMSRVKFNDLTNKLLDQNMKRTLKVQNTGSVGLVSSGSEHEMKEETAKFSQNIPKRKRKVKKSDLTGEGGACRSCKKSKCLKNYCECFAAGVYCTGPCACLDCSNRGDNEDTILQARRNNDSKVVTSSNSSPQFGEDPNITLASKLQKRVCNCNKSGCQRKYCACFKDGVGCSPICKCQGCKNIHGRKDSTAETKSELDKVDAHLLVPDLNLTRVKKGLMKIASSKHHQ